MSAWVALERSYALESVDKTSQATVQGVSTENSARNGRNGEDLGNGPLFGATMVVRGRRCKRERTFVHPLLSNKAKAAPDESKKQQKGGKKDLKKRNSTSGVLEAVDLGDDPLSNPLLNPLAPGPVIAPMVTSAGALSSSSTTPKNGMGSSSRMKQWKMFKERTRSEFSLSGKVKVDASFLHGNLIQGSSAEKEKSKSVALSKAKMRLDHLEHHSRQTSVYNSSFPERVTMSQKEYTDRIHRLHGNLRAAWNRNERVQALKIAIQCSKLLSDQSVPMYYPSLWTQVTEIMDTFGELVFKRIESLGSGPQSGKSKRRQDSLSESDDNMTADTRETCRNWFFKVACVRELLPRLYIEMALLPCYRFLPETNFALVIQRLGNMVRGIGDPFIGAYARAYLAHAATKLWEEFPLTMQQVAQQRSQLFNCFSDFLFVMKEFNDRRKTSFWTEHHITGEEYERMLTPALDYILSVIGENAMRSDFDQIMEKYEKFQVSETLFGLILLNFPPHHYSSSALTIVRKIKSFEAPDAAKARLFGKMAKGLLVAPPLEEDKIPLLNEVWKVVGKLKSVEDIGAYTECVASYIELTLKHYSEVEVLVLLKHLLDRLDSVRGKQQKEDGDDSANLFVPIASQLERICNAMCEGSRDDFGEILTNEYLMRLLDLFKSERKTVLCKSLLQTFAKSTKRTGDPVVIHAVFGLARDLHDSIDSLTFEDEKRQVAALICQFIERIDFGRDLEQHFNVLVDCRASFPNLDAVKDRLVIAVAGLAMKAHRFVKGVHSKRTMAFVKSCIAYCHITIPSITNVFKRLALFQLCGEVALTNQLLPQTDTLFKHVVMTILQVPAKSTFDPLLYNSNTTRKQISTEPRLVEALKSFLCALLPVPGHPEKGRFTLINGFLEAVANYEHWQPETGGRAKVRIAALHLLSAYGQRRFAIPVFGVDSNDTLFAPNIDKEYQLELQELTDSVFTEIMDDLAQINELKTAETDARHPILHQTCTLVLELVNAILVGFRVDNKEAFSLVKKLLDLVKQDLEKVKESNPTTFRAKRFADLQAYLDNTIVFLHRLIKESRTTQSESRAAQRQAYEALLARLEKRA